MAPTEQEFKKISTRASVAQTRNEAETLTDEELCATVDKSTGLIRFTLKRRRPTAAESAIDHRPPHAAQLSAEAVVQLVELEPKAAAAATTPSKTATADEPSPIALKKRQEEEEEQQVEEESDERNETMNEIALNKRTKLVTADHSVDCNAGEQTIAQQPAKAQATKQMSTESNDSSETSTSSMSVESIKSFVATKPAAGAQLFSSAGRPAVVSAQIASASCVLDNSAAQENGAPRAGATSNEPIANKQQNLTRSIVSETARRLEEAARARTGATGFAVKLNHQQRPVAAERKLVQTRNGPAPEPSEPQGSSLSQESRKNPTKQVTGSSTNDAEPGERANSMEAANGKRKTVSLVQPLRRSICWPPQTQTASKEEDEKRLADEEASSIIGKVSAKRLSFQRLIEQKSNGQATLTRPKPPPPAKPANLVLGRQH